MSSTLDDASSSRQIAPIQHLIYRYSDAVTPATMSTSLPSARDAIWESPLLGLAFATAQGFIDYLVEGSAALDVLVQTASNPVVELLSGERAQATTTILEFVRAGNEANEAR